MNSRAKGQAQLIAVFLLLILVPTTVIVAQNATNSSGIDGMVTDVNLTETTPIDEILNGTLPGTPENNVTEPEENIIEPIDEPELNVTEPQEPEMNVTVPEENVTVINETNVTIPEENVTLPEENTTLPEDNTTITNETNVTYPEENVTVPDENVTGENVTEEPKAGIAVKLIVPKMTTRGHDVTLRAVVENNGMKTAENVILEWVLPEFFEVFIGSEKENVDTLEPGTSFTSEIVVISTIDAVLGPNEVKVRVSYE